MIQQKRKTYPLDQSPLYKLANHRRLAELLKLDVKTLNRLARAGAEAYSVWQDENAKGKIRTIENPYPRLKRAQARLAALLTFIAPPDFLTCPVKGRSYVSNAKYHVGSRQIVTLDISAYFPSTTWKRVYWFFNKQLQTSADIAWTLASLATFESHLPTGSPLSPIMAYYAHHDMWMNVARIAQGAGCKFSVYMDDLTLSGETVTPSMIWSIKQEIHKTGLRLNDRKERRYGAGEGVVTGIVVTRDGVRAPKGSHLKLVGLRQEMAVTDDADLRANLGRKVRGKLAQHRQVTKQLAE